MPPATARAPGPEPGSGAASRLNVRARSAATLLVGLLVLALLFTQVPFAQVVRQSTRADPSWLVLAVGAALAVQVTAAWRLARLRQWGRLDVGVRELFEINLATLFYGLFLPGGNVTGIAVRFHRLVDGGRGEYGRVGFSLLVDRLVATVSLALVGCVFYAWDRPGRLEGVLVLMVLALLASGAATLAVLRPVRIPCRSLMARGLDAVPLRSVRTARRALHRHGPIPWRTVASVSAYSLLAHLLSVLSYWLVVRSMALPIGPITIGWMRSAIILATMIPVSASGLGLREAASWLLLGAYGVADDQAIAYSLLVFACSVLVVGLLGGLFEAKRAFRRSRSRRSTAQRPGSPSVSSNSPQVSPSPARARNRWGRASIQPSSTDRG